MDKVLHSSQRSDWETPLSVIRFLENRNGRKFDLDAAASARNKKAKLFLDTSVNSLEVDWVEAAKGGTEVWLNPPYGRGIGKWVAKAYYESTRGINVTLLLPARTDTIWFHEWCVLGQVELIKGRIRFRLKGIAQEAAPFPSMLVRFSPKSKALVKTLVLSE